MQTFIPLLYDAATLVLILWMVFSCAGRGFLRTVVGFLGYAAAVVGAAACAKPLAQFVYGTFIAPPLVRGIEEKLAEVGAGLLPENLLAALEQLPAFLFEAVGLDRGQMAASLRDVVENGGSRAGETIAEAVVAPLAVLLLKSAIFLLVFFVAAFLVRRLARLFGGVNRLPVVGPANRVLGGLVGLLQALLTMYVVVLGLNLLLTLASGALSVKIGGEPVVLAGDAVFEKTRLFRQFLRFNPIDLLLRLDTESIGEGLHRAGDLFV